MDQQVKLFFDEHSQPEAARALKSAEVDGEMLAQMTIEDIKDTELEQVHHQQLLEVRRLPKITGEAEWKG